jgi:hypothetical protein
MNERDPELQKLYREHSREEPPAALDAAILAAAHRAVASGPRKAGAEATRPQRWWMPLAAAATIGAVAIGVIQQMPRESAIDATSVAPATAPVTAPAAQTPSPPAAPPPPPPMSQPTPVPAQPAPAPAQRALTPGQERRAPAQTDALAKKQKDAMSPATVPPPPPAAPAAKPLRTEPAPTASAARENKVLAEPKPFPAAPLADKAEAASADAGKRDLPAEQALASARKDSFREERQAAAPAAAGAVMAPPPASPASPASVPPPAPAPATAERMRAQGDVLGKLAQPKSPDEEMRALARDPDAWIARIRKLRDEGNAAQALRELKEFRALVPDAERRLPADLRDWKS